MTRQKVEHVVCHARWNRLKKIEVWATVDGIERELTREESQTFFSLSRRILRRLKDEAALFEAVNA